MYSIPDIADVTTEQFDRTIKTNIYGTFWMTKFAVPHIPKGGSIIVTASQVRTAFQGVVAHRALRAWMPWSLTKSSTVDIPNNHMLTL
jgi:NAD(P)-dependent dehydrogenase (short-subunit alcohol dehydrogenase family)